MPAKKAAADPKNVVLPPFYAFGKLDKKGQISDKRGAAADGEVIHRAQVRTRAPVIEGSSLDLFQDLLT